MIHFYAKTKYIIQRTSSYKLPILADPCVPAEIGWAALDLWATFMIDA